MSKDQRAPLELRARGDAHRTTADVVVRAFTEWARLAYETQSPVEVDGLGFVVSDYRFDATVGDMVDVVATLDPIDALDRGGRRGR